MTRDASGLSGRSRGLAARLADSPAIDVLLRLLERVPARRGSFHVLTYHRVDEPDHRPMLDPYLVISPLLFEEHVRFLAEHYRVISLELLLEALEGRQELPPRALAITFDDGYRDFAEHAWPILKRFGLPVTLFVPTAFPGRPERAFWWDRLYHAVASSREDSLESPLGRLPLGLRQDRLRSFCRIRDFVKTLSHEQAESLLREICRQLDAPTFENPVLDWDALRDLAQEGVVIAPHSRTHPRLTQLPVSEAAAEMAQSRQDLARELGQSPPLFAYPDGACSDAIVAAAASAGFRLAVTTRPGINRQGSSQPLRVRRLHVGTRTTLPVLRFRLLAGRIY